MLKAGELTHRMTILTKTTARGTDGYKAPTWVAGSSLWAKKIVLNNPKEIEIAKTFSASATYKITVRHNPSISPINQIQTADGLHTYSIDGVVDPDGLKVQTDLYCSEVPK